MRMSSDLFRSITHALRSGLSLIGRGIRTCMVNFRSIASTGGIRTYKLLELSCDLAGSRLVFAEQSFAIRRPFKLAVRVDRVYDNGESLLLVELKTRLTQRIYWADIIELSAQRIALRQSSARDVAGHAYVLLVHPLLRRQNLYKVELIPEQAIVSIASRRRLLLAGVVAPNRTTDSARCVRCEYRTECHQRK